MKRCIFLIILIIPIILISCKNDGASIYAMEKRFNNFLNILPSELKKDFTFDSDKYGKDYITYRDELNTWIDDVINKENADIKDVETNFSPTQIEYAINSLVARNYERQLPYELMSKVVLITDKLAYDLDLNLKDTNFSNDFYKLKMDEAIVHFSTKDTTFYYVWNYLISIERSRRFQ